MRIDNSTPAKISFVVDGRVSDEVQLTTDMVIGSNSFRICYPAKATGDIDDVRMYSKWLTDAEILSIFEYNNKL